MCYVFTQGDFILVSNDYPNEDVYYIVKFTYDSYTLQEDVINYGRKVAMGKKSADDVYLSCL